MSSKDVYVELSSFSKKELLDTLERVRNEEPVTHYALLSLSYSKSLVIPLPKGNDLISMINSSEIYIESFSDKTEIKPLENDEVSIKFMSKRKYEFIKVCNLLGANPKETDEDDIPF